MSDLAALGVTVERKTVTVDDVELTELTVTLPKSTGVEASFSSEGLADKLLKIFKKEIQSATRCSTSRCTSRPTRLEATEALLQSSDLRAIIERVIVNGGAIEIDGNTVKMEIVGRQQTDDEVFNLFIKTLLG